jgi:hypothetical protein
VPQVFALALIGAGLYAGYRWFTRAARELSENIQRAEDDLRRQEAAGRIEKNLGPLEYDPATGVYRPARRD